MASYAKWELELESFLYFGGEFPGLVDPNTITEVPLPKGFYYCMECGNVTNYWEPGFVCPKCEYEGERQFEQERGN